MYRQYMNFDFIIMLSFYTIKKLKCGLNFRSMCIWKEKNEIYIFSTWPNAFDSTYFSCPLMCEYKSAQIRRSLESRCCWHLFWEVNLDLSVAANQAGLVEHVTIAIKRNWIACSYNNHSWCCPVSRGLLIMVD